MHAEKTESRFARRYHLWLPVIIRASIEHGAASQTGKTCDISARGVYFTTSDNEFNAGTELDLTVTLSAELTGGAEVFLRVIGKVVRVDKGSTDGSQPVGVAAVIKRYKIVHDESAIA